MKTKRTKLLSVLIALVLTVALVLPLGLSLNAESGSDVVWGTDANNLTNEGYFSEAVAAVNAGEASYIQLRADVPTGDLEINKSVTIDLNGYRFELHAENQDHSIVIDGEADVQIIDTLDDDFDQTMIIYEPIYLGATASLTVSGIYTITPENVGIEYYGGKLDLSGILEGSFIQIVNKTESNVTPGEETIVLGENQGVCTVDAETYDISFQEVLSPETVYYVFNCVTVSFDANGGEGTMEPAKYPGGEILFSAIKNSFTAPEGLVFLGWSTDKDGTVPEIYAELYDGITLYAIWGAPVIVGDVELKNGEYLSNDGIVSAEQPSGGYAYYKDGVLTLNNFEYTGDAYRYNSDYSALIYVENGITVELQGKNVLRGNVSDIPVPMSAARMSMFSEINAIASSGSVTFRGEGSVEIRNANNGIYAENVLIESGGFDMNVISDGIYAENNLTIKGGSFDIVTMGDDGLDAENVVIEGGRFSIISDDDGITAINLTINGGELNLVVGYSGMYISDTITITGGTITIYTLNDHAGMQAENVLITDGEINIVAQNYGIYADNDITIEGGQFNITADYNGLYANNNMTIKGGQLDITAEYDGIYAYNDITVEGGQFDITARYNGICAENDLTIEGGQFDITAKNSDGICAGNDLTVENGHFTLNAGDDSIRADHLTIKGGSFDINSGYGIYSNNAVIEGGRISIHAATAFYETNATISGADTVLYYNGRLSSSTLTVNEEDFRTVAEGVLEGNNIAAHTWAEAYQYSELAHWHACTDEACATLDAEWIAILFAGNGSGYGTHDFSESETTCSVCGYEVPVLGPTLNPDRTVEIYVGGVGLASGEYLSNSGVISTTEPEEGGYAYYENGELYLYNYVYEGAGAYGSAVYYGNNYLYIYVYGNNTLTSTSGAAIRSAYNGLYIYGMSNGAVLTLNGDYGIYFEDCGDLYVGDVRLDINAKYIGIDNSNCEYGIYFNEYTEVNIVAGIMGVMTEYSIGVYGTLNIEAGAYGLYGVYDFEAYNTANITVNAKKCAIYADYVYLYDMVVLGAEYDEYGFYEIGTGYDAKSVRIVSINGLMVSFDKDIENLNKLVAEGGTIDEINAAILGINEKLSVLTSADAETNGKVEAVEKAVSAIEAAITAINAKLAEIDTNKSDIASLNETVKTIQNTLSTLGTAAEDTRLAGLISGLETSLNTLSESLDEVKAKVEALEKETEELGKDVEALEKETKELSKGVEALEKDVEELNKLIAEGGTIDEINAAILGINEKLTALAGTDTEISGKVEAVEKAVSAIEEAITAINAKLAGIDTNKADIASLNETVKAIQGTVATLGTAAEDERLAGLISALDTSLKTLSETLEAVETRLDSAEDKISKLEEELKALEDEIKALLETVNANKETVKNAETASEANKAELEALKGDLNAANDKNATMHTVIVIVAVLGVLGSAGTLTFVIVRGRKDD